MNKIITIFFRNGIKGSAVCVYDTASLQKVFDGPFKYQKSKDSVWEPYTEPMEKTKVKIVYFSFFTDNLQIRLKNFFNLKV